MSKRGHSSLSQSRMQVFKSIVTSMDRKIMISEEPCSRKVFSRKNLDKLNPSMTEKMAEVDSMKERLMAVGSTLSAGRSELLVGVGKICLDIDLWLEYITTLHPNCIYEDGDDGDMECDDGKYIISIACGNNCKYCSPVGDDEHYDDDDDDVIWNVRRAAAKYIEAVIVSRHEVIELFYKTISPALIPRLVIHAIIIMQCFILIILGLKKEKKK